MRQLYLGVVDGSANSCGITGHGTAVTTLRVAHHPAILAAKVHLAKPCFSSTRCTKLRLYHLSEGGGGGEQCPRSVDVSISSPTC